MEQELTKGMSYIFKFFMLWFESLLNFFFNIFVTNLIVKVNVLSTQRNTTSEKSPTTTKTKPNHLIKKTPCSKNNKKLKAANKISKKFKVKKIERRKEIKNREIH